MQLGESNFAGEQLNIGQAFHLPPPPPAIELSKTSKLSNATRDGDGFNDRYRRSDLPKLNHSTAEYTMGLGRLSVLRQSSPAANFLFQPESYPSARLQRQAGALPHSNRLIAPLAYVILGASTLGRFDLPGLEEVNTSESTSSRQAAPRSVGPIISKPRFAA